MMARTLKSGPCQPRQSLYRTLLAWSAIDAAIWITTSTSGEHKSDDFDLNGLRPQRPSRIMSYPCTTTSLRLFIRSVAQIDLKSTVRPAKRKNFIFSTKSSITLWSLAQQHSLSTKTFPVTFPTESSNSPQSVHLQPSHHSPSSIQPRTQPHVSSFRMYGERNIDDSGWRTELKKNPMSKTLSSDTAVHLQGWENAIDVGKRDEFYNAGRDGYDGIAAGKSILEITPQSIEILASETLKEEACRFRTRSRSDLVSDMVPEETIEQIGQSSVSSTSVTSKHPKAESNENRVPILSQREPWQLQKAALKEKFQDGWNPPKRLSPDALAGIRAIHSQFPEQYTTSVLAQKFQVSPESIRRILKSKWAPKVEEELDRQRRWFSRGQKVWARYAELGLKPPKKWRSLGIGKRERRRK